jgi:hypothetical protein
VNPLKKGPDLKLSELRMPQFLVDLYYDLHDRHLLPVVGLLLVGIVAVPLLLGGSSESEEAPTASISAAPPAARTSSLVVTKEAADLRDYKRRLDHLTATDPFVQKYVEEGSEGAGEGGPEEQGEVVVGGGEESSVTVESGSSESTAPAGGGSENGAGGSSPSRQPEVVYFTYALDVRIVPVSVDGKPSKGGPYVRHDLPPLTMLPSRSTPALTYMGPSKDGKKALMLVSSDVTSVFGDSACVVGSQICQLLALEPGLPETVVFGANSRTYRIELQKIHVVTTDHLNRAPLGKPKPHGRGEATGRIQVR